MGHESALLFPCLGHVYSWPFYKMVTISFSLGNRYTAGLQKSSQTESRPFAEGAGTVLPPAGKMCLWEKEGVAVNMPTLSLALAVATVTSRALKKGHRKHASNGKSEVLLEIATFLEVCLLCSDLVHIIRLNCHTFSQIISISQMRGVRHRNVNQLG